MRKIFGFKAVRPNYVPLHVVTHREVGDIPGLVLAPRSGTFVNTTPAQAQAENDRRADAYARDVELYINEKLSKEQIFRSMSIPVYGAYGEKL